MSILGDIAGLFGGFNKRKALDRAQSAIVDNLNLGRTTIGNENNRVQGLLTPYTTAGDQAVGAESDLLGLSGDPGAQRRGIDQLRSSPYYQSIYQNGVDTVLGNASATGGLRGGNVQDSLARWGGDALAQAFQQQLQNLGGISGQGLQAINSSGQFGANAADNIASIYNAIGQAKAGGILGRSGVDQQLFTTGANTINDVFSAIMGGFGGGGGGSLGGDFSSLMGSNNAFASGLSGNGVGNGGSPNFLDSNAAFGNLPY